jgi:hypothetical protein
MTKGTKIAIGVLATLAVGGLVTWLVLRNRKPKEDEEWEEADVEGSKSQDGGTTTISPEQRKANNFASVKSYFGKNATDYGSRVVYKTDALSLEKKLGWVKMVKQPDGEMKMTRTKTLGLGDAEISVVYWEDGHFTVKIGATKAAIQGYYYNGGRIIKVTKGKGDFASKAGIRETSNERLVAIGRVFQR